MGQFMGKNPKTCFRRSAVACKRLRYAPCVTLQTLCVALLFILDLHYAEHALLSHVINCAFDQTNAFNLFVCLMLVCSFSPRVHSIPRGPHILKKRIRMMCCFCCMPDKNRRFYDIGTPNNAKKKAYRAASLFVVWNCGNVISSFRLFRESRCSPYSSSWGRSRRSYRLSARFACSRVVRDP